MAAPDGVVHRGTVREWHEDDGWGVIVSPELDSPVWAHFSHVDPASRGVEPVGGFRLLHPGDVVCFTAERAEQDGYHWRAIWVKATEPGAEPGDDNDPT